MNISWLPEHVIAAIEQSLKRGKTVLAPSVSVKAGDTLRGAGLVAIWGAWQRQQLARVFTGFTGPEQQSVFAMVAGRILQPCSKLALKHQLADTLLSRLYSQTRLDEDELYRVMDKLHASFYEVQERLQRQRQVAPVLCLYDLTSTYFEGTRAEEGAYGHSRDKRWDRYQIVIGLVCDEAGVPLAVEVWPGNTADRSTVAERVQTLKERFGIEQAVFVGDGGLYSETNIQTLDAFGFDYILRVEWHTQRRQLEQLAPQQLELFDRQGVAEWEEHGVRYVGCVSEYRRERAARRRREGMHKAQRKLQALAHRAARGSYYSWSRLEQKVDEILRAAGVHGLWEVKLAYLDEPPEQPDQKARLELRFVPDKEAIASRVALEGKYVLRTSLAAQRCPAEQVDTHYRRLQYAERAFRHIKSYLKVRPIYHYRRRRVRAHVLICFFAFYLVKTMELELRAQGETREVERVLQHWDKLRVSEIRLNCNGQTHPQWQWSLGELGQQIQREIQGLGWWQSLNAYQRSLVKSLTALPESRAT